MSDNGRRGHGQDAGFIGWSPETDEQSSEWTFAAVAAADRAKETERAERLARARTESSE